MRLVVDANILVAALLKDSTTRELLLEEDLELFAPESLLTEIKNLLRNTKVRSRLPLSDNALFELTEAIFSRIIFFPEKSFLSFIKDSAKTAPHIEDAPYLALARALKIPLWSNDAALKEQSEAKVLTTPELIKLLPPF